MRLSADNVADYADTLVVQALNAGCSLDYSESSIVYLESYFRISDDLFQRDILPEQQRNLIVFYGGCYLGEVMAKNLAGAWNFAENWFDSTMVFATPQGGIQIQPFQKVFLRISGSPADHSLAAYYGELRDRIGIVDRSARSNTRLQSHS